MCNLKENKNDIAWQKLFIKHNILDFINENGFFKISSREINIFREARLMTKFDHKKNLPILFQNNELSILPISRGDYVIGRFEAYKNFDPFNGNIHYMSLNDNIESLDYENINSESAAINCAYISGMLSHFLEDEKLLPTVSGRMSSGIFNYNINNSAYKEPTSLIVNNSQIEIDAGFEGVNNLALFEAKNSISSDFLIRQLYYPFRLWKSKISKNVKAVFLVYSNGIFTLYQYDFEDINNYNSLILRKCQKYSLERKDISIDDIKYILKSTNVSPEPEIPFPQANSFDRVINICELLNEQVEITREDITTIYDFDIRQTNYYTDAARYLGLIDKKKENGVKYYLTDLGESLFKKNYKDRQMFFVSLILQHKSFSDSLKFYLKKSKAPTKPEIVRIMKQSKLYKVESEKTFYRRASTILGWINWILELQK